MARGIFARAVKLIAVVQMNFRRGVRDKEAAGACVRSMRRSLCKGRYCISQKNNPYRRPALIAASIPI